jgi:hypothetical protein
VDNFFCITRRESTYYKEFIGGSTTFFVSEAHCPHVEDSRGSSPNTPSFLLPEHVLHPRP